MCVYTLQHTFLPSITFKPFELETDEGPGLLISSFPPGPEGSPRGGLRAQDLSVELAQQDH